MPNMSLLPKQPVVLYMGSELISKEGLELIRDGISEATKLESACMANTILGGNYHAQPVIPREWTIFNAVSFIAEYKPISYEEAALLAWNACRAEMLKAQQNEPQNIPAQPVSEPYKLPELNDELIEILGRPNFTCTKLAEYLRHCGQDIKRKSEYEQAAVLHVLLNLYIKHGNDWRKHAEEAFTPAVAQENE
ncbi:MAG: hypothetical protein RSA68_01930 [Hafnia sp.]|uniref:hypothetical protein n=1 Tax=Hafnia sp. TaxID=1873498 RepID=UPI002FC5A87C